MAALPNPNRFYVYTLADPRDGSVFYVGKGSGRRAFAHEREVRRGAGQNGAKALRIRRIIDAGQDVITTIAASGLTEREALRQERDMIARIGMRNLTNVMRGTRTAVDEMIDQAQVGIALCRKTLTERHKHRPDWIAATEQYLATLCAISSGLK
jgi:hypothetical protein